MSISIRTAGRINDSSLHFCWTLVRHRRSILFQAVELGQLSGGMPNNLLRPDVEQVLPSLGCAFSRCILQKKEVYCG
jgi:hypothetical protein